MTVLCGCGEPLHYSDAEVERTIQELVDKHGETVLVRTTKGAWHVSRHYVALHGLREPEVPHLAEQYGWRRFDPLDDY